MIYIDTSSFLKLFLMEPESRHVEESMRFYDTVIVSPVTELEARVQLKAFVMGGIFTRRFEARVLADMAQVTSEHPFLSKNLGGSVFRTALLQHERSISHCRSLDRLHLAAMEEFGAKRLMTHDLRQAGAARELGYEVVSPGL